MHPPFPGRQRAGVAPVVLAGFLSLRQTEAILAAIARQVATFRVADLQTECPGVGVDLIRLVLARLQKKRKVKSLGTGRAARWQKTGN